MKKEIHIGKLIAAKIEERGMTKAEFARRLKISSQAITPLLKRAHINTLQLQQITSVLEYDFFQHYITIHKEAVATSDAKNPETAFKSISYLMIPIDDEAMQQKMLKKAGITK